MSNPIERAFELAKSGEYQDIEKIEQQLSREGYVLKLLQQPMRLEEV